MVLADPALTLATDRLARFLRIEKAVSQPEDDVRDIDNTAFGVTTAFGMKEIVGYAMIEPDGSVITKVPANAALMISVVDENGMQITQRHQNWISLAAGQELKCNGCHDANSGLSHGRKDAFDSAYAGAPVAGGPFLPGTDPALWVADVGETMAEIRARITCVPDCSAAGASVQPSMDVIYRDVWSENPLDVNGDPINPDIMYRYRDLTTASPTSLACMTDWSWRCRSIINYEDNIHPLWNAPRLIFDVNGDQVFNLDGSPASNNCLNCHTPVDPVLMMPRVPAGQLDLLTDNPRDVAEQHSVYRELLVTDNLQVLDLVSGMVIDATVVIQDADGNDILVNIPYAPPARAGSARASSDFFDRFNDPNDQDHFNIFSKAEQRLVAEWLDIGAQYYNNPFDAPAN